jgi:hypothetical protein
MEATKLSSKELKEVLTHIINNNKVIQDQSKKPVAVSILGHAGLGKTTLVEELQKELKLNHFEYVNLAQIDELGDLVGIPIKQYWLTTPQGKGKWIDETIMEQYKTQGWTITNNSRMGYAKPQFIAGKGENGILLLDDYTRCQPRFMQAVMEIISKQEYISWKLPKNWTVICTENPDDGTYNVSDTDPAAQSRKLTFELKYDVESWAEWAEKNGVDRRCISFMLLNPEIIKTETPHINPRSLTKFFDTLTTITEFESNLSLVRTLAEGAVGSEVASLFCSFINNKMDKMISPERIMDTTVSFEAIQDQIKELIKEGLDYRADLAFVVTTRLINYLAFTLDKVTSKHIDRLADLIKSNCLGTDLKFVLAKKVTNQDNRYNALLVHSEVVDIILE